MADDLFVPNPVIASMQVIDDARDVREIEILSETIRVGRQMGFSRSKIVDADNPARLIALSEGSGVSIGQPPPGFEHVDNPVIDVVDSPSLPPLHVAFGARQRAPGVWELPELSDELSSPDGVAPRADPWVLEAAAMDLVAHEAGTDAVQVDDWHVMFVARQVGPFRGRRGNTWEPTDGWLPLVAARRGQREPVVTSGSAVFRVATWGRLFEIRGERLTARFGHDRSADLPRRIIEQVGTAASGSSGLDRSVRRAAVLDVGHRQPCYHSPGCSKRVFRPDTVILPPGA
jgi:hypothetical protein